MKQKLVAEVQDFVNLLYTMFKVGAGDFAKENFTKLINDTWDDNKPDDENLREVKSMFEFNKQINRTGAGNPEAVKVIEAFQEGWLNKINC